MVKDGRTCLGLEYFVFEGDELWNSSDDALIERGKRELQQLGLVDPQDGRGRLRRPDAQGVPRTTTTAYQANVDVMRRLAGRPRAQRPPGRT